MAVGRFIRVVSIARRHTGAFAGEEVQYGISFVDGDAGGVFSNAIREALPSFTANPIGESSADATWDMAYGFEGQSKVTKANQLGIANAFLSYWNLHRSFVPSTLRLEEVRITAFQTVPTAGGSPVSAIGGASVFYLKAPSSGTGPASTQLPPQLALAISLRTGARGPGGRGRFFTPFVGQGTSNGLVDPTLTSGAGGNLKTLLDTVRGIGPLPAVVNAAKGTYSAVTWVAVGNQFDVQRRRRESVPETYTDTQLGLT